MARFDTSGFDQIIKDVTALGEKSESVGKRMLLAAAEEVKKAWKAAAAKFGLRDTGDMIDSIGFPNEPSNASGVQYIDIYPRGKDRHGVRNAEKAFILHYGVDSKHARRRRPRKYRGPGIPPTHWVDEADKLSAAPVQAAFERIWDDFLNGGDGGGS